MKKLPYQLSKSAAVLQGQLKHFQRLLNNRLFGPEPRPIFPEDEFFFTNLEVANFIGCSVRTVRRLRKQGKLAGIKHGNVVLFHIPTILDSISKDDRLSALFTRKPLPRRIKKTPVIRYRTFTKKGWLFIEVRFKGWKSTIVCQPERCTTESSIRDLVKEIFTIHQACKPFKISPDAK